MSEIAIAKNLLVSGYEQQAFQEQYESIARCSFKLIDEIQNVANQFGNVTTNLGKIKLQNME